MSAYAKLRFKSRAITVPENGKIEDPNDCAEERD
jgi:hypothetical protein